jgi:hypothetical protein
MVRLTHIVSIIILLVLASTLYARKVFSVCFLRVVDSIVISSTSCLVKEAML